MRHRFCDTPGSQQTTIGKRQCEAARNSNAINMLASPSEKLYVAEPKEVTPPGSFESRGEAKSFGKRDRPREIVPILLA